MACSGFDGSKKFYGETRCLLDKSEKTKTILVRCIKKLNSNVS